MADLPHPDGRFTPHSPGPHGGTGARVVSDEAGVEWEIYDETSATVALALDWDYMPQLENPGLIFTSRLGLRRLWPAPPEWRALSDAELADLAGKARSIF